MKGQALYIPSMVSGISFKTTFQLRIAVFQAQNFSTQPKARS